MTRKRRTELTRSSIIEESIYLTTYQTAFCHSEKRVLRPRPRQPGFTSEEVGLSTYCAHFTAHPPALAYPGQIKSQLMVRTSTEPDLLCTSYMSEFVEPSNLPLDRKFNKRKFVEKRASMAETLKEDSFSDVRSTYTAQNKYIQKAFNLRDSSSGR
jgi:hypothetical protein